MLANAQAPEPDDDPAHYDDGYEDEVIIEGQRSLSTSIRDIIPDSVFGTGQILSLGVTDMGELIDALTAETGGDSSEPPILLLDGRPVSNRKEIRRFPSEAVRRVEILPPKAALKFSSDPNRRVMNFVLRRRFNAVTANTSALTTTDGGGNNYTTSASYLRIHNKTRIGVNASYSTKNHISEAERGIEDRNAGRLFAVGGNVTALDDLDDIDSRLSQLAGESVTVAGVPMSAMTGRADLADFLGTANTAYVDDYAFFRDLQPDTENLTLGGSLFKPIGERLSISGSLTTDFSTSDNSRGFVSTRLLIPENNPFSPFQNDIRLYRADGPLGRRNTNSDIDTSLTVFGDYPDWRWSVEGQFASVTNKRETERSISSDDVQNQITAGDPALNPFGPLALTDIAISDKTEQTAKVQARVNGRVITLPSGFATASVGLEYSATSLVSSSSLGSVSSSANLNRDIWQARAEADIPLFGNTAARRAPGLTRLRLSSAVDSVENAGELWTYGAGLSRNLTKKLSLQASIDHIELPAKLTQLGDPVLLDPSVRVTDFATGNSAIISRVTGGNPDLRPERRRNIQVTASYRPSRELKVTTRYRSRESRDSLLSFPFLTPQIASAFPDRLIRDASGQLIELDARPLNAFKTHKDSLRTGLNWRKRFTKSVPEAKGMSSKSGDQRNRGRGGSNRNSDYLGLSLYHTWRLKESIQFREDSQVFDLLDGASLKRRGGEPTHDIEARLSFKRKNTGGALFVTHESGSKINVDALPGQKGASGRLKFDPLTTANLRLYYDIGVGASGRKVRRKDWRRDLRVTLDINNVANKRPAVLNELGQTPFGYEKESLDPLGRTVKISIRKLFSSPPNAGDRN